MSYQQQQTLRTFIPSYVVKSDYLPTVVHEGNNPTTADLLRNYQAAKARGQVYANKPAEFNPGRYVSYCVNEHVAIDRVLDQDHFSRVVRR